ncbi:hypothetical protein J7E99_05200 [Streptomyces sp. ISL-44]|uniref:hypothetical protein n=1 Tax=Streptomyces sp. ISL-44 TaxID=2819184 RepID=UPI001BE4E429|nr:hypothetical protein [Streptomyces sp. ISL-44]MBT2540115.1 hypothetical protein [Streptomyces sp. ISL-44]
MIGPAEARDLHDAFLAAAQAHVTVTGLAAAMAAGARDAPIARAERAGPPRYLDRI